MKIATSENLLKEVKEMLQEVKQSNRAVEEGMSENGWATGFVQVVENLDRKWGSKEITKYSLQISVEHDSDFVSVGFGKIEFPSFEHVEFTQRILDRYQEHQDEYGCTTVPMLDPETAVEIVLSVLHEYDLYRSSLL